MSNIKKNNVDISFTVDKIGVPVLVKTSFFPNWTAEGAKGPYRSMPNFMVVIPTSNNVKLHYGYSGADKVGYLATFAAIAGVVLLHRTRRRRSFGVLDELDHFPTNTDSLHEVLTDGSGVQHGSVRVSAPSVSSAVPSSAPPSVSTSEVAPRVPSDHVTSILENPTVESVIETKVVERVESSVGSMKSANDPNVSTAINTEMNTAMNTETVADESLNLATDVVSESISQASKGVVAGIETQTASGNDGTGSAVGYEPNKP